ncbi:MAG: M48 family metallopeptidase [Phycisphaerales bacterium]
MLHVSLIVIFAAIVLRDESRFTPPGVSELGQWTIIALTLAPLVWLSLVFDLYARICARKLDRGDVRAIGRADLALTVTRTTAVALHVFNILVLGWLDAVRSLTGGIALIDGLIAVTPPLAVIILGWWSIYPLDRRARDAMVISDLDQGRNIRPPMERGPFVWMQSRHQLALVVVPMLILLAWRGFAAWGVGLFTGAAAASNGTGWRAAVDTWLSVHDRRDVVLGTLQLVGVAAVLLVMPLVLSRVWDTAPLEHGELFDRLTAMCRRQGVRVRRLLVWRTQGSMVNGAVIGFVGPTRYILLTDSLLESLPREQVEAVMAHEIGHVRRRHVPWLGVTLMAAFGGAELAAHVALRLSGWFKHDRPDWMQIVVGVCILAFVLGAGLLAFGWVSRRFEWQADAFAAQQLADAPSVPGETSDRVTPNAVAAMAGALEAVARLNHIPMLKFSFRHGSIATRIERLKGLVGRPIRALPIDRQVAAIKAVSGLLFGIVLAAMVIEFIRAS